MKNKDPNDGFAGVFINGKFFVVLIRSWQVTEMVEQVDVTQYGSPHYANTHIINSCSMAGVISPSKDQQLLIKAIIQRLTPDDKS